MPVHPHSRGVYGIFPSNCIHIFGSSPLAWGIRDKKSVFSRLKAVHPHSRGVYTIRPDFMTLITGSSPLAWGIHLYFFFVARKLRGSSPLAWGILNMIRSHVLRFRFIPTRVGYTGLAGIPTGTPGGSSPLAWGIHKPIQIWVLSWRFIPTRVGYTCST